MAIHPIPESRSEWLKLRSPYVGASEVSCLLGFMGYKRAISPSALFHIKSGNIKPFDFDDDRMMAGRYMEPAIANWACDTFGWKQQPGVFATDDECPGLSATLDRVVMPTTEDESTGRVGPGALECKNVALDMYYEKWADDEPPASILIQLQAQLACAGWKWGAVAWCVSGNDFNIRPYMRDDAIIGAIRKAVTEFWAMVAAKKPPPVDHYDTTIDALKHLYPHIKDEDSWIDMRQDNELPAMWDRYKELGKRIGEDTEERDKIKARVRELLGSHKRMLLADGRKISRSIAADVPDRSAREGEIIKGWKGQDTLHFTKPKGKAA